MEISLTYQIIVFATSVALGFILNLVFDFFKIIELMLGKGELKTFIVDVVYFIFCAFISFLYMMVVSAGEIRIFYIAGEAAGWLLSHFTVGRYIFFIWTKLAMYLWRKLTKLKYSIKDFIRKHNVKIFFQAKFIKKNLEK